MADITAARLNNLQSRVALILGTGSGDSGYGQTLASSQVASDSIVSSSHLNNIYTDMVKSRIHQVGVSETGIRQVIANLNTIAEDTSGTITDAGVSGTDVDGTKKGVADFETLMTAIETDKLLMHASQAALEPKLTSTRTATWNGLIYHIFTATFADADARRHFFNSGGEIRLSANNTNPSTPKGLDWAALCSEIGIVRFTRSQTFAGLSGQGYYIGDDYMSSSYQTVYAKVGAGSYSGIYAGNLYTIKARETSSNVIEFRIEFNDVVVDNNVDNNVDGALTSTIQQYRAVGASSITVTSPSYFTSTALSGFSVPVNVNTPTYVLGTSAATVVEGNQVTITLTTTNVANNAFVPYTITGVTSADISNASLTGSLVVMGNSASLTYTISSDLATEGTEVLTFALNNGLSTVSVTITDTSVSSIQYNYSPHWYNEYKDNYLLNIPSATAATLGEAIATAFYNGTGTFLNTAGETRYALNRRPDVSGLAYWTREYYNNYYSVSGDSPQLSIPFYKTFFTAMDIATNPIPFNVDGVALSGVANSDSARSLLATKARIVGDGFGDFGDRGTLSGVAPTPAPPTADFAYTVTPNFGSAGAMNFNSSTASGALSYSWTVTCTAGSGSVTIRELTRPSNIAVAVGSGAGDISYRLNYPSVTTAPTASKAYFLGTNQARSIQLYIHPTSTGTFTGSFTFFEASGVGSTVTKGWGGTFTS